MRKLLLLALVSFCASFIHGQDTARLNAIMAEGRKLYQSEMASWYGTDVFLARFKHRTSEAGGYFSYPDGASTHCIFYSKDERVLVDIAFGSEFSEAAGKTDSTRRAFLPLERSYFELLREGKAAVGEDTFFRHYQKANYNYIPLIDGGTKKVYIITGTQQNGVVLFGNDYLMEFSPDLKLLGRKRLHVSLIPLSYAKEGEEGAVHSHLPETGDYLTPTDVCTLLLYQELARWKTHMVVGPNFITIWNAGKPTPLMMTREAMDRIRADVEKRRG